MMSIWNLWLIWSLVGFSLCYGYMVLENPKILHVFMGFSIILIGIDMLGLLEKAIPIIVNICIGWIIVVFSYQFLMILGLAIVEGR